LIAAAPVIVEEPVAQDAAVEEASEAIFGADDQSSSAESAPAKESAEDSWSPF
jgi:hypothetical protein